jgi:hypothetical protein
VRPCFKKTKQNEKIRWTYLYGSISGFHSSWNGMCLLLVPRALHYCNSYNKSQNLVDWFFPFYLHFFKIILAILISLPFYIYIESVYS